MKGKLTQQQQQKQHGKTEKGYEHMMRRVVLGCPKMTVAYTKNTQTKR